LYAALTAFRLGLATAVVTARADLPPDWPAGIAVAWQPSPHPPIFENRYTSSGREQVLHAAALPIALDAVPPLWQAAPIVHLGPVLGEVHETFVHRFPGALIGVTPQGWMRSWQPPLPARVHPRRWEPADDLLARIDALVLSIEDINGDLMLAAHYARSCRLVVLTRAAAGATVYIDQRRHDLPALPAVERDQTGAGDVFAAALLVRLREVGDPLEAAWFAAAVAACSVEAPGPGGIPSRAEAEQRLLTAGSRRFG
jgi:hypothetical protein